MWRWKSRTPALARPCQRPMTLLSCSKPLSQVYHSDLPWFQASNTYLTFVCWYCPDILPQGQPNLCSVCTSYSSTNIIPDFLHLDLLSGGIPCLPWPATQEWIYSSCRKWHMVPASIYSWLAVSHWMYPNRLYQTAIPLKVHSFTLKSCIFLVV